jgi:hypothetical protein
MEENDYPWKDEQEKILKKWADKGQCYKAMHERAYKRYTCLNAWFSIPVIILSTITGTGNFALNLFGDYQKLVSLIIGGLNLFAAIISTIAQYTSVAQKSESHRITAITWDKFSRKIQIELAKSRKDRTHAKDFVNKCSISYDRLIEVSPIIPNDIIRWFNNMIETGRFEEDLNELNTCCYECFCFPFGCKACNCSFNCNQQDIKTEHLEELKKAWKAIELPEILGRIHPTEIAHETEISNNIQPTIQYPIELPKNIDIESNNSLIEKLILSEKL